MFRVRKPRSKYSNNQLQNYCFIWIKQVDLKLLSLSTTGLLVGSNGLQVGWQINHSLELQIIT